LNLNDTLVSDLFPLGGLSGLSTLSLRDTNVSDLAALRNLRNLTTLDIRGTKISLGVTLSDETIASLRKRNDRLIVLF
ncbi:MAG: hypothetical protein WBW03_04030, partial [Silvibacterium sp.]